MSKNVMPQTDLYKEPISVGIDELQKYEREPCACLDEIQNTGAALRAACSGQAGMGWVLLEKEHTEELSDGTYIKTFLKLALSVDNGFIAYRGTYEGSRSSWLSGFGRLEWVEWENCPVVSQGDWNKFLAEFDFDCYIHREDRKYVRGDVVGYASPFNAPFTELKRKGKKGSVLLDRLNAIAEEKIMPASVSSFDQYAAAKRRREEAEARSSEAERERARAEQAPAKQGRRFRRRCRIILAVQHIIIVCLTVYHNNGYVLQLERSSWVFAGLYAAGFVLMLSALDLQFKGRTVLGSILFVAMLAISLAAMVPDFGVFDYIYVAPFECFFKLSFMLIAACIYRHRYGPAGGR